MAEPHGTPFSATLREVFKQNYVDASAKGHRPPGREAPGQHETRENLKPKSPSLRQSVGFLQGQRPRKRLTFAPACRPCCVLSEGREQIHKLSLRHARPQSAMLQRKPDALRLEPSNWGSLLPNIAVKGA